MSPSVVTKKGSEKLLIVTAHTEREAEPAVHFLIGCPASSSSSANYEAIVPTPHPPGASTRLAVSSPRLSRQDDQWHLTWRAPCLRPSNSVRALKGLPGYKVIKTPLLSSKLTFQGFGALLASPKSLANRRKRLCGLCGPRSKAYAFIKKLYQREPQLDFWLVPILEVVVFT
ncbi:hypothetical protein PAAG_00042 [Paracoccidioides lutzii Pb01]|uniref:Uncharacterized protein n=1 Tax=Paracoccidioides lutzii (strain ATCC MYA-826 / Pb01) TaxID=502779 RepID=C1GNE7_PARBA|nr:hypothetical protein PAAG_00042 [Paracoccidioides lutzii Pb01]EEH35719.2 hypothetical protein PAAG_00042 [Paracoccidioides lutzii Pb01]